MENEFYTGEFEQLIKEKADQFRMYPSKRVWHSIYNNLHPSRRWPSVIMSLFLFSSLILIGYLNTGDNSINQPVNSYAISDPSVEKNATQLTDSKKQMPVNAKIQPPLVTAYENVFNDIITNETDFYSYTVVKNNRPNYYSPVTSVLPDSKVSTEILTADANGKELIQNMDTYIKANKIFTDIAAVKNKTTSQKTTTGTGIINDENADENSDKIQAAPSTVKTSSIPASVQQPSTELNKLNEVKEQPFVKLNPAADKYALTPEEKNWIENYAFQNKPAHNKWKGRLAFQFYATPAVNYRKLSTKTKGSVTAFANADINKAISQKPGAGFESGIGLNYSLTKDLLLKVGVQFNYTNYNIDADKTTHPIITTILLNDPASGVSYAASRTSTTANPYNSAALQPITLHNRTYQLSVPVGFAYKLSSKNNVDWFAGASVQPTYVFGGNAHIISSDLQSYVSDPSSIRTWNLNLGFETYMNFKIGGYNLQVGPQVRYQIYSTYRKDVALIEKPYAVGLKLGLTKGF